VLLEQQLLELNRELTQQKKKLEEVLQVESGLGKSLNLHKMIDFAVEKAVSIIGARKCTLLQVDEHSGELCVKGHYGIEEEGIGNIDIKLGDRITHLIALHEDGSNSLEDGEGKVGQPYRSRGFLSVPIFAGERLFGLINLSDKSNLLKEFSDLDLQVLNMIVRQLAVAVENARLARELHYWEARDNRLNIYNYRHCCRVLDYEISRARRYGDQLSVLMINIDAFRFYNEALGHKQGDKFLQDFSRMLDIHLRDIDTVCRYVGDEFVIILPGTNEMQARIVADKIDQKTREMSVSYPMSVSIGLAQLGERMSRYDLIRKADGNLRLSKTQG
jgi:diguanylate cyclase (GGDEF)-like protein